MTGTGNKYKIFIIKFFALLSIIRWQNILLVIIAQYLAAVYVLNPHKNHFMILSNHKLHLMAVASAFIIAGGYIINSFYDIEKDLVNRPEKTLFGRLVSRRFCLNCYFLFNTIGLILAFSASIGIFMFYFVFALFLWAYSHKFQKITFVREITASLLSVTSFFSIGIFYKYITVELFAYGCFAMMIIFSREIIKDIESYRGNNIFGYNTLAGYLGIDKSANFIILINAFAVIPIVFLIYKNEFIAQGLFFIVSILVLIFLIYKLIFKNENFQKNAEIIHIYYKIFLVIIIFFVMFVR